MAHGKAKAGYMKIEWNIPAALHHRFKQEVRRRMRAAKKVDDYGMHGPLAARALAIGLAELKKESL